MKILVTGAAGFMGSHLVDRLVELNYEVYGIDDLSGGYLENIHPKSVFLKLDLRDREKTERNLKRIKPKIIFHLAADATEGRSQFTPINCTQRNYSAYLNLLVPAIGNGLIKMVLISSMSVYGSQKPPFSEKMQRKPDDIYGISKASMERSTEILSKVYDFKYSIIRPHNVYGPRQNLADPYRNVIAIFINCLMNNKHFYIYGDGEQKRAFSYIDDVTPYIIKAAFLKGAEGEVFNIGPTEEFSINHLAHIVLKNFFQDKKVPNNLKPVYLPERPMEVRNAWCTANKAKKILGYRTTVSLEQGIAMMMDWARKTGAKKFRYLSDFEILSKKAPKTWSKKLI